MVAVATRGDDERHHAEPRNADRSHGRALRSTLCRGLAVVVPIVAILGEVAF